MIEDIKKFDKVKMKLSENSLTNEDKEMLNAPSNNKKSKVNVVKTGAICEITPSGETYPNTFGPRTKPRMIRKRTSGILNFLKINSAKNPKKRIKLAASKTKITSTI